MKDLEQLVQYLDGELNEAEKQKLIEELKRNPELNGKLDLIKDFDKLTGDTQLSTFEETLKEVESEYLHKKKATPASKLTRKLWMQIAAMAIIIISVSSYFFIKSSISSNSAESLYAAYYEKLPADFATRSENNAEDLFINAIKLYNENRYEEAISEFEKILKTDASNNAARLFLGICYTETNNFEKASGQFKTIIKYQDPIFEEHAAWYLSLCYIKTKNQQLAAPLLRKLVENKSFYMGKASDLLKKLK